MLLLDAVWLTLRYDYHSKFFFDIQKAPMKIRIAPAVGVYLLIAASLWYFVFGGSGSPDRESGEKLTILGPQAVKGAVPTALLQGSILGFSMYGMYDLTNFATLKEYTLQMTITDTLWGTFACGMASGATAWLLSYK